VEYIANQENLEAFARRAASSSVLAIDTEFLREKTYYANLCLLQLATDTEVAVVDPFAIEDLAVVVPLLEDPSIVKLFHAGSQDLEILYRELGVLPSPLFDTQVAATLLGHTQQIGYGPLVHSLCGVNLQKSDSFTDWSRRPLSDSQLEYAADDVVYLPKRRSTLPALVVELKWNKPSEGAIRQIKERNYPAILQDYDGEIVLVGIGYDAKKKAHSCVIERI